MKQDEVHDILLRKKESLDIIREQILWLLDKSDTASETGSEIIQRFFGLYRDFLKIKKDIFKLSSEIDRMNFKDKSIGLIYKYIAHMLFRRCNEGIFLQFTSVAETGELPKSS